MTAPEPVSTRSIVPKWVHDAIRPVVLALEKYIPQPYAGEIRGLASSFGDSIADVIILNFAYEISAYVSPQDRSMVDLLDSAKVSLEKCLLLLRFCTSIVAQDKNGTVYHGRNLDYSLPELRNMTFNAVFLKKGKVKTKQNNKTKPAVQWK